MGLVMVRLGADYILYAWSGLIKFTTVFADTPARFMHWPKLAALVLVRMDHGGPNAAL